MHVYNNKFQKINKKMEYYFLFKQRKNWVENIIKQQRKTMHLSKYI